MPKTSAATDADPAKWLTVDEMAAVVKTSPASVYRRVKSGDWPHRKPAGLGIRFSPQDCADIEAAAYRPATRGVLAGVA